MDPGSLERCPQAARTEGEHFITAGGHAHHGGINRIAAATAGQQHSRPAAIGRHGRHDTFRRPAPVRHRRRRVSEIRQTGDRTNRHDPLPSSPSRLSAWSG
jgi:hypothetical protein